MSWNNDDDVKKMNTCNDAKCSLNRQGISNEIHFKLIIEFLGFLGLSFWLNSRCDSQSKLGIKINAGIGL